VGKIAKNVLKMSKNARFLGKNCEKLSLFGLFFNTPRANNRALLRDSSQSELGLVGFVIYNLRSFDCSGQVDDLQFFQLRSFDGSTTLTAGYAQDSATLRFWLLCM